MIALTTQTELIFSMATMIVSGLLFRFLTTGGPQFTVIGNLDPDVVDKVFEVLMWLCGAVALFQMFHIIVLVLTG